MAVGRGHIDAAFRQAALDDLEMLDIRVDPSTNAQAWRTTVQLADKFRLTVYDAAYLELAQRRGLGLATLDVELGAAAASCRVGLLV
jgi:predicted nucleic acid-binding protein